MIKTLFSTLFISVEKDLSDIESHTKWIKSMSLLWILIYVNIKTNMRWWIDLVKAFFLRENDLTAIKQFLVAIA